MKWLRSILIATATLTLGAATVPVVDRDMVWYRSYTAYADEAETDLRAYAEFYDAKGEVQKFEYQELGLGLEDYDKLGRKGAATLRPTKKEKLPLIHSEKAEAAIAYDTTANSGTVAGLGSVTYAHTMPSDGTLVIGSILDDTTASDRETTSCTYNGDNTYFYNAQDDGSKRIEAYVLPAADSGSNNIVCTFNSAESSTPGQGVVISGSFTGTDLHIPTGVSSTANGNSAQAAVSITTTTDNEMVLTFAVTEEVGSSNITASGSNSHTERVEFDNAGVLSQNFLFGSSDVVTPAGAGTYSWDWVGNETWGILGLSLRPPCNLIPGNYCTDIITAVGTTTWTAPTGVTSVDAACWGAGGGGENGAATGNGGGGGGAYASTTGISVTPGVGYDVYVGTGGAVETAGGVSQFKVGTSYTPIACGGLGATTITGAAGGTTACSVGGAAETAGGTGGTGVDVGDTGGGGGGAGDPDGTSSNGTNSTGTAGGAGGAGASTLGGTGGRGGNGNPGNRAAGGYYGGGGGGGGDNGQAAGGGAYGGGGGGGEAAGGTGGNGMCHISYTVPTPGGGGGDGDDAVNSIIWFLED